MYISISERVKKIRERIKKEFPDYKFSITRDNNGVRISIVSAPLNFLEPEPEGTKKIGVNNYYIDEHYKDYPELRDALKKINDIASEGVTYHETSDYGRQPTFYVSMSIGSSDNPFIYAPKKNTRSSSGTATTSTPSKKWDRGQLLKECAGWKVYKKTLPDGRIVYNALKDKETEPNRGDWATIKSEIYIETGFKWGRFGSFDKWGEITESRGESGVLDNLCEVLNKYYSSKEQPKNESPESPKTPKTGFSYGKNWGIPEDYGKQIVDTLSTFGFEILENKANYFSFFRNGVDLTLDVSDNGGEFNIVNAVTQDFIGSLNYIKNGVAAKPFTLAKNLEDEYILSQPENKPQEDASTKEPKLTKKEEIQKAIAGLQILADKGNEKAKKAIIGLQYLLNK